MKRRDALAALTSLGIGSATFHRALADDVEKSGDITAEMISSAEWVAGLELTEEERTATLRNLRGELRNFASLRQVDIPYHVPPAIQFAADPTRPQVRISRNQARLSETRSGRRPANETDLAFLPVHEQAALIRDRKITSLELTQLYLKRLRHYDRLLKCVVTITEKTALEQARRADAEIATGRYRGPLHGIPWGAKDLMAWPGYRTTWGAPLFQNQELDEKATVARRLEDAGAVLVAKLTLGALAMGDKWFGGMTRNPWNTEQGSSGSSAGSASAVVAGLVGFAIGTETLGSILSPCRRCGVTGLRPTFGRVSRHGCMPLSWSMDKVGPIARSAEDCALILDAIHGADGLDPTAVDQPFHWPARRDVAGLRVGYVKGRTPIAERADLNVLRDLGVRLVEIQLPHELPASAVTIMLEAEAATVFDDVTREHVEDGLNAWPAIFRAAQFIPAVEYIRAARVRTLLMQQMDRVMQDVDLYVGGNDIYICNLTGHPTTVVPAGLRDLKNGRKSPRTVSFTGRLFGESELMAVAAAWQNATTHHLARPDLDGQLKLFNQPPVQETSESS